MQIEAKYAPIFAILLFIGYYFIFIIMFNEDQGLMQSYKVQMQNVTNSSYLHVHQTNNDSALNITENAGTSLVAPSTLETNVTASPEPRNVASNTAIAIVTYLYAASNKGYHFSYDTYKGLLPYTLTNMMQYAQTHGHAFYPLNSDIVAGQEGERKAFWGKGETVVRYLDRGFEWVLWTDVDVLFMDMNISLRHWIEQANSSHSIILVDECNGNVDEPRKDHGTVRSGFFLIRNTEQGRSFLTSWKAMYNDFREAWNPDQTALEALITSNKFAPYVKIFEAEDMHSYPHCIVRHNTYSYTFSVHFPGYSKSDVPDWFKIRIRNGNISLSPSVQLIDMVQRET